MLSKLGRTRFIVAIFAVSFGSSAGSSCLQAADEVVLARSQRRVVSDCQCGRWACPSCQSRSTTVPNCAPDSASQPVPMAEGQASPPGSSDSSGINLDNGAFGNVPGAENVPGAQPQANANNQDLSNLLAMSSSAGAGFGGSNSSSMLSGENPGFFGDFFGPEGLNVVDAPSFSNYFGQYQPRSTMVTPGGRLGRQKLVENNTPIPQNRVFINYSRFSNVPFTTSGVDVDRVSPGFEKTFLGGLTSVEFRSPFGTTVGDTFTNGGQSTDPRNEQFGNIYVGVKGILLGNDRWVLTSGLSVLAPTADNSRQVDRSGNLTGLVDNGSVHLMPFIGGAIQHSSRHFSQWMVQVDVDATGSDVMAVDLQDNQVQVGTVQQQNLIYVDLNTGYWLFRAPQTRRYGLTGIAWLNELHINQSLDQSDVVAVAAGQTYQESIVVNGGIGSFQNINAVTGLSFEMNRASRLGIGYAVPLGNGSDNPFSNEIRLTFNRYF